MRLDLDFDYLLNSAKGSDPATQALRIARGLAGYRFVFQKAVSERVDLLPFTEELLASPAPRKARAFRKGRDLTREILTLAQRCRSTLKAVAGPTPVYYILFGHPDGTNARSFGPDPLSARPRVLLNLCRLDNPESFEIAVLHETVHTLQRNPASDLLGRAIHEGTATFISRELRPGTSQAAAMMWSEAEWAAAQAQKPQILATFQNEAHERSQAKLAPWLTLGVKHPKIKGAPSRSGYFVGYCAAQAWITKHPKSALKDLLRADPNQVANALHAEQIPR